MENRQDSELDVFSNGAFDIVEAVRWSGIGRSVLYRLISEGEIVSIKVGKRRLVSRDSVRDYLERRHRESLPSSIIDNGRFDGRASS